MPELLIIHRSDFVFYKTFYCNMLTSKRACTCETLLVSCNPYLLAQAPQALNPPLLSQLFIAWLPEPAHRNLPIVSLPARIAVFKSIIM